MFYEINPLEVQWQKYQGLVNFTESDEMGKKEFSQKKNKAQSLVSIRTHINF